MRTTARYFTPLFFAAAGTAAAVFCAPMATAEPTEPNQPNKPHQSNSTMPQCVNTGGSAARGGSTTLCESPGNAQLNATPAMPAYPYPWDDEFYGPAMIMP